MATYEMTDDQEAHLKFIKYKFSKIMEPKFRKGAEEHATLLHEQPKELLLDYAIEEAIDQVTYLFTLKLVLESKDADENVGKRIRESLQGRHEW